MIVLITHHGDVAIYAIQSKYRIDDAPRENSNYGYWYLETLGM